MDPELTSALQSAFKAVSVLTSWADSVIIRGGQMEAGAEDDYMDTVIEPVRRAVIVAVNCISVRIGAKSLSRGNSLPDITGGGLGAELGRSTDSLHLVPPLLPKARGYDEAPPLPPKHLKPKLERFEDLLAHSLSLHSLDWSARPAPQSVARRAQFAGARDHDQSLPSPRGLDTTLPDLSFDCSFDNSGSPRSASRESLCYDEADCAAHRLSARPWPPRGRSATSSPSLETISFCSRLSDPKVE